MAEKRTSKATKMAVPAELRRRMQTEHGEWLGFRMITIGNFYSYAPHLLILKEYGLLEDDLTVLANLNDWGGMSANVICTLSGRRKNSISRAVLRMTERGFIEAETDVADRRKAILTITAAGREMVAKAAEPFRAQEQKMFGVLTRKETNELDRLMLKILKHWSDEFSDE